MAQVRPRAAVLATIGAAGIGASAYFVWLAGRTPEQIPLRKLLLVGEVTGDATSYWQSMAAPLVVVSAVALLGAVLLSRLVLLVALLLGLTTAGLWAATDLLETEGPITVDAIGIGAWISAGAMLLLLIGLSALRKRGPDDEDAELDEDESDDAAVPDTDLEPSSSPFGPLPRSYSADD